jgi:hypothetical protein
MADSVAIPLTSTGVPTTAQGWTLTHHLAGWYFSEVAGVSSVTVTIRQGAGGPIIWQHTINPNGSVGEDYNSPISIGAADVHVTISGLGTCQGHIRGR